MKKQIYYADLTPCDNMQDYKVAVFVPQFVTDDTKEFDTEPPIWVVQLATICGWCIVAKWRNNGSTRIYGGTAEAIEAGVSILGGCCDSGNCGYVFGEEKIYSKFVSEDDISVFDGYTDGNIIEVLYGVVVGVVNGIIAALGPFLRDRKSTRLNSSHS